MIYFSRLCPLNRGVRLTGVSQYKFSYFPQIFLLPFFLAQRQSNNPKLTNIRKVGFIIDSVVP